MRANNRGFAILIVALAGGFLYGLWKLYDLRFAAGDIYPPYSSLRADPLGAKALYDGLARVPGVSTARNYRELPSLRRPRGTVLVLGADPFLFEVTPEDRVREYEDLARGGARVVIAMRPVSRLPEEIKPEGHKRQEVSAIEKRWGVRFAYITRPARPAEEESGATPKLTALYFRVNEKAVNKMERPFGSGAVVLLANCYPFSNEALAGERDAKLLAWALGSNRNVVFDEHHLGLTESGGVVTLARKYHLEGVAAALLVLLGLFIWKNSTSFLPPRLQSAGQDESVAAKDAASGLANLLRRNIPAKTLIATCLQEWDDSQQGGKFHPAAKIQRVRALAWREGDAVEQYRNMSRILSDRSDG